MRTLVCAALRVILAVEGQEALAASIAAAKMRDVTSGYATIWAATRRFRHDRRDRPIAATSIAGVNSPARSSIVTS